MFKSENFASRQAERCEAMFPGRVHHEEELHGQGHLCPVRATHSSVNNANSIPYPCFMGSAFFRSTCHSCPLFPLTGCLSGLLRSSTTASVQTNPPGLIS